MIGIEEVERASRRLTGVVRRTAVVESGSLSKVAGRPVLAKPEHFQRTGSFKVRGAYNRISAIAEEKAVGAVVAASAGNHGQGVALAAALCGLKATIFMPDEASLPKVEATRGYGATVSYGGRTIEDCITAAREAADRTGAVYVPPFDDPLVVAGQGTIGLELLSEARAAEVVVVPIGGGGLISGIGVAIKARRPSVRLVGVEPVGAASMAAAVRAGTPVALAECETVADGVAVPMVSALTLEHVQSLVDDLITVDEDQISHAVLLLLERCKWVVEPAGALALAGILAGKVPGDGPALALMSGGNVDPLLLTRLIEHGLTAAGRYLRVRVILRDRPGVLAELSRILGELHLNILSVEHRRSGAKVGVGEVEVWLTVETRDPEHRDEVMAELAARGVLAELVD